MSDFLTLSISGDCQLYLSRTHHGHDGVTRRTHHLIARGKGMALGFDQNPPQCSAKTIILPVGKDVSQRIVDFCAAQKLMAHRPEYDVFRSEHYFGPYYFTMTMQRDEKFEAPADTPHFFGGPDTSYARRLLPGLLRRLFTPQAAPPDDDMAITAPENDQGLPYARYNCWTATQGITQYIAGIDIAQFAPELVPAYRAKHAMLANKKIGLALENESGPYEIIHRDFEVTVARLPGCPSFLRGRPDGYSDLDRVLSRKMTGTNGTIEEWLSTQSHFTAQDLSQHKHNLKPVRHFKIW